MKRILPLLAAALFLFFAIRTFRSGTNDFIAYYSAGARVLEGHSPYVVEATPFRYLPFTAFLFAPLSLLPLSLARWVFFLLNFAAAFVVYRGIFRKVGAVATLLLVALFFRFHNHDFQNAQVNPILLLLFFLWWKTRKKNLLLATLAFSVFASFKVAPFAIGLVLLYERQWREIIWIGMWTVVLNFLPIFFVENGPFVFKDWFDQAKNLGYPVPTLQNIQSLPSALWWWLQSEVLPETFVVWARTLQIGLPVLVLFLFAKRSADDRFEWMSAAVLATTALLAPLAWKHNYLQFLPLAYLWFVQDPNFREVRTRALYAVALLGMAIVPSLLSSWDRNRADRLYVMVWAGLAVIFLSARFFRSRYSRSKNGP